MRDAEAEKQMRGGQVAKELYGFNLNFSGKINQIIFTPALLLSTEWSGGSIERAQTWHQEEEIQIST